MDARICAAGLVEHLYAAAFAGRACRAPSHIGKLNVPPRHRRAAALLSPGSPSFADISGTATVVDGDTLVVAGERIRLEGIDAPELHQECTAYGQQWACGRSSAEWVKEHLNGRQVECVGHARDRYGRLLAVCYVGGESINERIVREG